MGGPEGSCKQITANDSRQISIDMCQQINKKSLGVNKLSTNARNWRFSAHLILGIEKGLNPYVAKDLGLKLTSRFELPTSSLPTPFFAFSIFSYFRESPYFSRDSEALAFCNFC